MKRLLHVSRRSIWRYRDLRIMLPARALSFFGDELAAFVLTLRVYAEGRGPWAITGLLLCFAVPVVVLAPVAGRLVDAVPFRALAVATGIWQAACCVGLAAAGSLWSIYVLVVVLQTGQVVAAPTWQALIPSIAEREEVGRAVGTSQALSTVASVAAPAAAALAVASLGYGAPRLVDGATVLVLAGAGLALRTRRRLARDGGAEPESKGSRDGFSLRSDPLLWPLLVGLCALVLVGEVTNVVEVFMVRGTLGASTLAFGLVAAVLAGGIVVGSMVAGRNAPEGVRAQRTVVAALVLAKIAGDRGDVGRSSRRCRVYNRICAAVARPVDGEQTQLGGAGRRRIGIEEPGTWVAMVQQHRRTLGPAPFRPGDAAAVGSSQNVVADWCRGGCRHHLLPPSSTGSGRLRRVQPFWIVKKPPSTTPDQGLIHRGS